MKKTARFLIALLVISLVFVLFACNKGGTNGNGGTGSGGDVSDGSGSNDGSTGEEHVCSWGIHSEPQKQTCLTDGIVNYACSCGKKKTEIKKATGHSYTEWEKISDPTCEAPGESKRSCAICHISESSYTERLSHSYTKYEVDINGDVCYKYECGNCRDNFVLPIGVAEEAESLLEKRLFDCPIDFSFLIYSTEDENYIRENLIIFDTYYEGSDNESDGYCEYVLTEEAYGIWRVSPAESYSDGATYRVVRSGSVILEQTGFMNLSFSIFREESLICDINDEIVFLSRLEKQNPGYYPYDLEYSENSGSYLLTLKKIDGLKIGDILCIGEAESIDDIKNFASVSFGKISLITYSENEGVYYLVLTSPDLGEIFDKLDIHSSHPDMIGDIKFVDGDELTSQVVSALYSSRDFVDFMGASYVTATELLSSRGAKSDIGSFAEFLDSIQINEEESQEPELDFENGIITAKVVIDGKVTIPITVTSYGTDRNVGNIIISFKAYVSLDYAKLQVTLADSVDAKGDSRTDYKFGISQSVTVGFTFDVAIDVDYSLEAYPYVVNRRSGCYHFASCIHVASMNEANAEYVNATELLRRINEGEILDSNECGTCRPISSMESDNYVLNRTTKKIHLVDCNHLQTVTESELLISGSAYGNLELAGYSACESCKPYSKYTNSFSESLMRKMENGDFGHNVEEIKAASDKAGSEEVRNRLLIAEMPLSFGILRADIELYAFVNFTLDASLSYKFERTDTMDYGVELKSKRFVPYTSKDSDTNIHQLDVMGQTRLEVGAAFVARAYVLGLEKWMYASFNVEVGAYALANGALRLDWVSENESYFAAYFESGFILNVYFEGKIPLKSVYTHVFYEGDYPFIKLGYQYVAHKFTELPEYILLEDTFLDLNRPDLMTVGYYDVVNMSVGTSVLNYLGIPGRYDVEYGFADGGNCFIENGIIYVIDPSISFVDELIIHVKGYDEWDNFRSGNTKFTLPDVSIPIVYEARENVLAYDISGDRTYYYVIGIGNYSLGDLVIPESYNDKPVLGIERHAFSGCMTITSVTIPDTMEFMDDHAFYYCENLTSIVIGNGIEILSQGVFNVCTNVSYISIGNNVKIIGEGAFGGCSYVTTVIIPDSVIEIQGGAFSDCFELQTVFVGRNVESFGRHAFSGCRNLTNIYIPKTLTGMGDNVFYYCDNLTNIYYQGSESDMMKIQTDESNIEYVEKATVHFNYNY